MEPSSLQQNRYAYLPKNPKIFEQWPNGVVVTAGRATEPESDRDAIKSQFAKTYGMPVVEIAAGQNQAVRPLSVGVILSGGQAPGGHNVIAGIFDALQRADRASTLIGFLGGPSGILQDRAVTLDERTVDAYRNTGGFDLIGSGRTKIETHEQFEKSAEVCKRRKLDALVIIGGDDSNTNAAVLAEYFRGHAVPVTVVGVPKTIDGDLKNDQIETSFGFDTATKTYAELIGNIERDADSARKYWHFIKLMGRSASHITLECALQTHPNVALISEEIERESRTLTRVVEDVARVVARRAAAGLDFGVVLIPEGLVEFIPEMKTLIDEINGVLAQSAEEFAACGAASEKAGWIAKRLTDAARSLFTSLPHEIRDQLLMDRDPHGNVQVSRIETELLLSGMVADRLAAWKQDGSYSGSFSPLHHFFGYEGRCAFPSNFDADYCYALGYNAAVLAAAGMSGYMSIIRNLARPAGEWEPGGIPITMLLNLEKRHGEMRPVIRKALVELDGAPFKEFAAVRDAWAEQTAYVYPGAIQYWGPDAVCNLPTKTLQLERPASGRA
jgi:diphosphate-dependent phosphofructokinase